MTRTELLYKVIKERVLLLDGAMGSLIQTYKLEEDDYRGERFKHHHMPIKGNNDILSLSRPDIIKEIHAKYLEAGSDIIETNTFNATSISQADYDMQEAVWDINFESARIAREVADEYTAKNPDKPRFVCGSIGPLNKALSLSPDVNNPGYRSTSFDEVKEAYKEQVRALIKGGSDLLMIETVFDTLNAKAALFAIDEVFEEEACKLPIMVSGTITDASGRTLSGQTLQAFIDSISHMDILSIGLNCSLGAEELEPYVTELSKNAPFYISTHPNAGLPNQFGEYDQTPNQMSALVEHWMADGKVNIIGGCCGTTPEHIAAMAKVAARYNGHQKVQPPTITHLSGLESLQMRKDANFVNIGERCNVAGSRKFLRLIKEKQYEEAVDIARHQVENGAQIVDVNMDDAMLDAKEEMVTFLNMLMSDPDVSKVPVMVDSSKFEVIEAGLKCLQGKSVVNSISLKEGEEPFLEHARIIKKYGAAVVVMAFDEKGQADTFERRKEICGRAYRLLTEKVNFPPQDIIFDPNVLAIATGIEEHNNYAVDFIKTCKWIKENLPHAHISGGISNLSFSFRGNNVVREAIHSVFLYYAIQEGLDMGIVNPAMLQVYDDIPKELLAYVEDVVLNKRSDATDRLVEYAEQIKNTQQTEGEIQQAAWREGTLEERLSHCLVKGISDYLDVDIAEALEKYPTALDIIEQPLMDGMNVVGELFGSGKMFLPQVVKTARVMKKAVAILQPIIEEEKASTGGAKTNGKIVMATVKGDVHDIGKNIVGVILGCNNYEVIDLGVMVPTEEILKKAIEHGADIIGLSGLITPSLEEMVTVAKEMKRNSFNIPLLIGGATTSKIHTAVKIEPEYDNPVVHVKDASKSAQVVSALLSAKEKDNFVQQVKHEYAGLRERNASKKTIKLMPIEEARARKHQIDWSNTITPLPAEAGVRVLEDYPISEIRKFIDWTFFYQAWRLTGNYDHMESVVDKASKAKWLERYRTDDAKAKAEEALKLYRDSQAMLDRIEQEHMLQANAVFGIFPANSVGDDIEVYTDESRQEVMATFHHLREQQDKPGKKVFHCLSDYVAPKESKRFDHIGGFAVTAGVGIEKWLEQFEADHDDYSSILLKSLADRLAEAFAELLHYRIRTEFWGYAPEEVIDHENLIRERYRGIRPALGYPACPDHSEKRTLFDLLQAEENAGITLTEHYSMYPNASVSGIYLAHPDAIYFGLGKIGKDQVQDVARRKGCTAEEVEKWIPLNLEYK
ncbi:methionine synthase [Carboxylicivirga mesophila]|uniref:Methionine synthase n=1 Tax=Carboxylicivirga mesophila TaxID=1166478 RepID=A0ABS5KFB7_9BACT|nr:methionine synthase [Carboxylicivirga mesophila]MBS2213018.1 methionine synthase [Carboxylicivirga mesophila]